MSGFVGGYLSREFIEHGYTVIRTDKASCSSLPSEVGFYESDLLEMEAIESLANKTQPDIIVNLAAISNLIEYFLPCITVGIPSSNLSLISQFCAA